MFLMGDHILKPSLIDATGVDGDIFQNISLVDHDKGQQSQVIKSFS